MQSISGLSVGVHNVTVLITDSAGNIGIATILFTIDIQITTATTTTPTTTTTLGWSIITLLFSTIALLYWRKFRPQR